MRPMLKAPGTKRLKQQYASLLSNSVFNFNMRRYTTAARTDSELHALTVSQTEHALLSFGVSGEVIQSLNRGQRVALVRELQAE